MADFVAVNLRVVEIVALEGVSCAEEHQVVGIFGVYDGLAAHVSEDLLTTDSVIHVHC